MRNVPDLSNFTQLMSITRITTVEKSPNFNASFAAENSLPVLIRQGIFAMCIKFKEKSKSMIKLWYYIGKKSFDYLLLFLSDKYQSKYTLLLNVISLSINLRTFNKNCFLRTPKDTFVISLEF